MQNQIGVLLFDNLVIVSMLFSLSMALRVLLSKMGQNWINTTSHTITLTLLPIITYTVTKVISGDIALSLGMVGALSIVRFRNPVRSPLELSVYFGAITMGISASVSSFWLIFLAASMALVIIGVTVFDKIYLHLFQRQFLTTSFAEGNQLPLLEVTASGPIEILEKTQHLQSKHQNGEVFSYVLMSPSFEILQDIEKTIADEVLINEIRLSK